MRHLHVSPVDVGERLAGRVVNAVAAGDLVDRPRWPIFKPLAYLLLTGGQLSINLPASITAISSIISMW
jgi:hypothetical protein